MVTILSGVGNEGWTEVVTIHLTLVSDARLFYAITVVPEAELETYRATFNRMIASVQFR